MLDGTNRILIPETVWTPDCVRVVMVTSFRSFWRQNSGPSFRPGAAP